MRIGYFLSSEEHGPRTLVGQARAAEQAGFEALWISDHFHPWNSEQGQSPFVWGVIGALSEATSLEVTTAVTCPMVRTHPAVIAHAAATAALQLPGGFRLGVGTGEALNEHITGERWPTTDVRLEMLEEAVDVMRQLLTGERVDHHGTHYTVEDAKLYTCPEEAPQILMSGFGEKAVEVAARIADGFITTQPDGDAVASYRSQGGRGPTSAGAKVCYKSSRDEAVDLVHRLWPNIGLPGELAQVLPSPKHFEQASEIVTREMVGASLPCGPDLDEHITRLREYAEAGFDELYISQIGPHSEDFFKAYASEVLPALKRA